MIQELFVQVLKEYAGARDGDFSGNPIADILRTQLPKAIRNVTSIGSKYMVEGSPGQGNWAEVPWIAVFDKEITESAQGGYYIVYLFNARMKGIYLSLNQGWTQYEENYQSTAAARDRIKVNAEKLQVLLSSKLGDFSTSPIFLDARNTLGRGYELGHICGKYYRAERIPADSDLVDDLRDLVEVYREAKEHVGRDLFQLGQMPLPAAEILEDPEDQLENNEAPPAALPPGRLQKPVRHSSQGRMYYLRNPGRARTALIAAQYRCELEPRHLTFKLKITGNPYMETHHFVPMKFQDDFDSDIDVPENIVSLCPTCHHMLHKATDAERKHHIEALHKVRRKLLLGRGIDADISRIFAYYGIR